MSALQIKCYLLNEPITDQIAKSTEIRRFALAQTSVGFYDQLVERIQQAYGKTLLPEKEEIKTYWLDDENELVCFSTDPELQYAVDLQTALRMSSSSVKPYESGVFKVYLVRKEAPRFSWRQRRAEKKEENKEEKSSSGEEQPTDEANVFHPGVTCDSCSNGIYGPRYKCQQCPDYDLCQSCKDKNVHKEHEFTKISKPANRCPHWIGHHRGHAWRHWRQHWRQHRQQQQQQQGGEQLAQSNPLQDTLNHFMPHIANSIPIVYNQEQLKNVGEYLKQFLDPFGIDVSYYVDSLSRNTTTGATGSAASATSGTEKKEEKAEDKPKEDEKNADDKPAAAENLIPMQTEESKSDEAKKSVADAVVNASANKDDTPVLLPQASPVVSAVTTATKTSEPSAPSAPIASSPFEAAASALKNVLEKNSASSSEIPKIARPPAAADQEFNGFNLVDMDREIKFINCIEQLKAMGYTDDGGWLTRLVIAKDGNINSVLDSLHPKN